MDNGWILCGWDEPLHNDLRRQVYPSLLGVGLLASACAGRAPSESRIVKARWDSSLVNRAVDVLLRQAVGYYTLWHFGEPGQFAVFTDSVPQLYSGFVVEFEYDSVSVRTKCSANGRVKLVGWRPLPDLVGVQALIASAPATPRRASGLLAPPGRCPEGGPDSLAWVSTYQIVDRSVRGLGHFAVIGPFCFNGGIGGPWTRDCRGEGANQWAATYAARCEEAGFAVRLQLEMVRGDSLWLASGAPRHRLEVEAFGLPAKRYRVNCANRRSSYLCPSR